MKEAFVQEIIACLPKDRSLFYYFKDRYALMLLSHFVGDGKTIREIRESRMARLLHKPLMKPIIQEAGHGWLNRSMLESFWPQKYECYRLTLGQWGVRSQCRRLYDQTSRCGVNLVLRLNFSGKHNRQYEHLIVPSDYHPFKCYSHPIERTRDHTLAWARIDMDFDQNEALIEEIQTDWIRFAVRAKAVVEMVENGGISRHQAVPNYVRCLRCEPKALIRYVSEILKPHIAVWDEAMLAASIWFLKEEIGIGNIFYHTYDSGARFKRISGQKPPKSLYTVLPRKFCFKETNAAPQFLAHKKNKYIRKLLQHKQTRFFILEI